MQSQYGLAKGSCSKEIPDPKMAVEGQGNAERKKQIDNAMLPYAI